MEGNKWKYENRRHQRRVKKNDKIGPRTLSMSLYIFVEYTVIYIVAPLLPTTKCGKGMKTPDF